jgi:signal recognition particle receptor subunit beta
MVLFNYSTKELTAKVVYYGPGLCGKTTNLQWIHEKLPIKNKGKMLSLATEADRTLFFDFLPIELGTIRGMKTRVQLYTVPGQVFYNATRRMVLKGADSVVFVADSQEAMVDANADALENLRENLIANEINPDEMPIVIQYNKRDLPNALPVEILNEKLNPKGWPHFEAVAKKGIGVEETLKGVTAMVFKALATKYGGARPPAGATGPTPTPTPTPAPAARAAAPAPRAAAPPPRPAAPPPRPAPPPSPPPRAVAPPPPPVGDTTDDVLESLDLPTPEPLEELPLEAGDELSLEPPPVAPPPPDGAGPLDLEDFGFETPPPPSPRAGAYDTLQRTPDAAEELRRQIARSAAPEPALEELNPDITEEPPALEVVTGEEISVPVEVELPPGATELRIVLHLKVRRPPGR